MGVKVIERKNANGTTTQMLEIWHDGKRTYERLAHLQLPKSTTPIARMEIKQKRETAKRIAIEKAKQLQSDEYGIITDAAKNTLVTEWMQDYVNRYKLKDKRNMQGVFNRFVRFLAEEKKTDLKMKALTDILITDFRDYLKPLSKGEGAASYFTRFKKIVKSAYKAKMLLNNPAADVKVEGMGKAEKKDILTLDEISRLAATPIQSEEIKKALLLSCFTGLRWVDVKALQWGNIKLDADNPCIQLRQSKTGNDLNINLSQTALKILNKQAENLEKKEGFVFDLPTANGANKTVKAWVKRAGIDKKITWHNARHSFGTNLVLQDVDVLTTSKLLGHASLKHTQRYVDVANEMKQKATEKLNVEIGF